MANNEHLEVFCAGNDELRKWLSQNDPKEFDLSGADLSAFRITGQRFRKLNLSKAKLSGLHLEFCTIHCLVMNETASNDLTLVAGLVQSAILTDSRHHGGLWGDLHILNPSADRAKFTRSKMHNLTVREGSFRQADFVECSLYGTLFDGTNLDGANFAQSKLSGTSFTGACSLVGTRGLDATRSIAPSSISTDTLAKSVGSLPDHFLAGIGLSDWEIEFNKLHASDLNSRAVEDIAYKVAQLRTQSPIQLESLFVSYSHLDRSFVDKLCERLKTERIAFFRDSNDLVAGPLEKQLSRAMRLNPTVVIVLSQNSVASDWVEWEANEARSIEKELGRPVLCPIALDDRWKTATWPGPLKMQMTKYHILPFNEWENAARFDEAYAKLRQGIHTYYAK